MDNTRTGAPVMGLPPFLCGSGWSAVAPSVIGAPTLIPGIGCSAVASVTTEALPIVQACDMPGHLQQKCMACQVSFCSVCDGHSC
ncbi:hypothetical protein GCM10010402_14240 [Actinomadura luteofluorescens]